MGREPLDFDRDFDFPLPEGGIHPHETAALLSGFLTCIFIFSRSTTPLRHLQDLTEFPHALETPGEPYSRTP